MTKIKKIEPNLAVKIGRIRFKNPLLLASGTCGYGLELSPYLDLNKLGGLVVKGLSLEPNSGNPPPRTCETPAGMLNAIGLENIGIKAFIAEKLPRLIKYNTGIIANFFGKTLEEYVQAARLLCETEGITALEMNISCPNIKEGGIFFGSDPHLTGQVVRAVKRVTTLPLIVKLSPNVTNIGIIARAAEGSGADILSLINTVLGMAIEIKSRRPKLANITGGLSGPAIRPIAVRMVWEASQAVKIPLIGIGGITDYRHVLEFVLAGASAVQIGTANLVDPGAAQKILEELEKYCRDNQIKRLKNLVGRVKT